MVFKVARVETTPFDGQKPGTSGLRKKVKVFMQPHYLQNFVQSTFNALGADKVRGATLVVSGDGRYYSKDAIQGSKSNGAFILTASHNPGGPHEVDISIIGVTSFAGPEGQFDVDVFDSASDYVKLMKSIFDFQSIQKLLSSPKFTFCYDALHGVAGAYAKRIFVEELGAKESSLLNCVPKEDFGGGHPDPNLTYAKELVARMGLGKTNTEQEPPEFGAAADGDADRNMILGKRFFVTPSDSVAIIAANAVQAIPYFSGGLKGVARSMPTSAALDVVAKNLNLKFFEVPTGWKFFGNLMDAGMCSFVVKKVLALDQTTFARKMEYGPFWLGYLFLPIRTKTIWEEGNFIIKGIRSDVSKVVHADEFEYKDPVDGSISKHQGIRYLFEDGSRLVFRLSGTGSEGATIRLYIEQYEKDSSKTGRDSQEALAPLVDVALKLSKMKEFTGRDAPTVIT
ncbi:UNVERIFIED_CONTAM: Phosphoglucomutase, cytoplasmic [Sesamum radiatum]|uniref:phosphoglucomutase (alpha-D-glucose-1,6-bisphosphate-dependent) n=1 Tax=Sesamum radiatum TaxID=300843 RepID=A0AAW2U080_SESRA